MNGFTDFLLGPFLIWAPFAVTWVLFVIAGVRYVFPDFPLRSKELSFFTFRRLIISALSFKILFAIILTIGQYYVWSTDAFTERFLSSPLTDVPLGFFKNIPLIFESKWGYFVLYTFGRFWMNVLITIGAAWIFAFFLKMLRRYRERFFLEGEIALSFLCALLVGWPSLIVYVISLFLFVIFVSLYRLIVLKELYTTIGLPVLLAGATALIFGMKIIKLLNLEVLKI